MDILKIFSFGESHHDVNIQGTNSKPLFQANHVGQILGIKNIRQNIADYSNEDKVILSTTTKARGAQSIVFLSESGLYRLISKSKKPEAKPFQDWVVNVVVEIREKGRYELKQEHEVDKRMLEHIHMKNTHDRLIESHDNSNLVYICKIKNEEGDNFIIKIGSTQNIKQRIKHIEQDYNFITPMVINIFACNEHTKLEHAIHNNEIIKRYRYTKLAKHDGSFSREVYLINQEVYKEITNIVKSMKTTITPNQMNPEQMIRYEGLKVEAQTVILEQKKLDTKRKELELEIMKLRVMLRQQSDDFDKEPESDSDPDPESVEEKNQEEHQPNYVKKRMNGTKVPKVYQYKPDDLKNPIRVFDSPAELERTLAISLSALKKSIRDHTIYKDHRWIYVPRNERPPEELEPSVATRSSSTEVRFIAMIDIKKTHIVAVYPTQKIATEARNMKCTSFTRAIKTQSISSGHYWNFFDACSTEMQSEFLKHNKLPDKHVTAKGLRVQVIDPITKNVIDVMNTKRDVTKKYQISMSKLKTLLDSDEVYQGHLWKSEN